MAKAAGPVHFMVRIKAKGAPDRIEDLVRERYSCGRGDPDGTVTVDLAVPSDPHLSREHCVFERRGDTYAVSNLSANGTRVNERAIDDTVALGHKDRIEIGGATSVEFLVVSDEERAALLRTDEAREAKPAPAAAGKKKSFLQSPVFVGILAFYGVLALMLMAVLAHEPDRFEPPGPGPYFQNLITEPVPTVYAKPDIKLARTMWERVVRSHGGPLVAHGPHAFRLVTRARTVLGILGYGSLEQARGGGDAGANKLAETVAAEATEALAKLNNRLVEHYREAMQYERTGHGRAARGHWKAILDAVPERESRLRRYAAWRAEVHRHAR